MKKILIVKLSSLGDIIHTFPMIEDIKKNFPLSQIDWLVDESFVDLVKLNKHINNVISISIRKWKQQKLMFLFNIIKWQKKNKFLKYDYIIDVQGLLKSAILTKFFIGTKYGFDINSIREKPASFLYDIKIHVSKNQLAVNRNRLLASKIFQYSVNLSDCNFGILDFNNKLLKFYSFEYIVIIHATSKLEKKYPLNNWIELITKIIQKFQIKIILLYGNEIELLESQAIKNQINSDLIIIPDKVFSYDELMGILYWSNFVLGVDTGLVHLANALNKKLIAIFTATNSNETGIIESNYAKNLGNKNHIPQTEEILLNLETLMKVDQ